MVIPFSRTCSVFNKNASGLKILYCKLFFKVKKYIYFYYINLKILSTSAASMKKKKTSTYHNSPRMLRREKYQI